MAKASSCLWRQRRNRPGRFNRTARAEADRPVPSLVWRGQGSDLILVHAQGAGDLPFRGLKKARPGQAASSLLGSNHALFQELVRCLGERKNGMIRVRRRASGGLEQEFLIVSTFIPPDLVQIAPFDLTEDRAIRRALRESERMYRYVYDNLSVGLSRHRASDHGFLLANQALAEMLGYASVGQLMADPEAPTTYLGPARLKRLTRSRASRQRWDRLEIETRRKDGERLALQLSLNLLLEEGCFETLAIDVTKEKEAREALERSEARLRGLSADLLSAQERERKQIARELHDGISQSLAAIRFGVEAAAGRPPEGLSGESKGLLEAVLPMLQAATDEVRALYENLRPPVLDDRGLLAGVVWFLERYESIYTHVRVDQNITLEEDRIPDGLKIVLFRVLQEALNNAARHAEADRVTIGLKRVGKRIELTVADNGRGFAVEGRSSGRGMGLAAMRERTELSGGRLAIDSAPGRGTRVQAAWLVDS